MPALKVRSCLIVLGCILFAVLLLLYNGMSTKTENFYTIDEAEKSIGQLKLPNMPSEYSIKKIEYTNDGFTTPILVAYYQNKTKKELIFITTSNIAGDMVYDHVFSEFISDVKWIVDYDGYKLFEDKYVLKWRDSNQSKFKYFITSSKEDKSLLLRLAEEYQDLYNE